ncbi:MAG: excisionase family DNA-binding protein [Hormoscilla sp. GM7CHS1pb]|nr:excisionase family DNA-binding protein [Hormoscilla sp. GM7CHS1pb]
MNSSDIKPEPIVATSEELADLALLSQLLNGPSNGSQLPRIISPEGEEIELPKSMFRLLRQAAHQLTKGNGVIISTFHQPLTISEAAALLNVDCKYVVRLVKNGEIPFFDTGWEQRIELDVVMAHESKLSELHRRGIQELAEISQECGLYPMEK